MSAGAMPPLEINFGAVVSVIGCAGLGLDAPAAGRGEHLGGLVFGDLGVAQTVVATEEHTTRASDSRKVCGENAEFESDVGRYSKTLSNGL